MRLLLVPVLRGAVFRSAAPWRENLQRDSSAWSLCTVIWIAVFPSCLGCERCLFVWLEWTPCHAWLVRDVLCETCVEPHASSACSHQRKTHVGRMVCILLWDTWQENCSVLCQPICGPRNANIRRHASSSACAVSDIVCRSLMHGSWARSKDQSGQKKEFAPCSFERDSRRPWYKEQSPTNV